MRNPLRTAIREKITDPVRDLMTLAVTALIISVLAFLMAVARAH